MSRRRFPSIERCAFLALLLTGCAGPDPARWADLRDVTPTVLVAGPAGDAAVASDRRGRVALTWVTRDSLGQDLWLSLSADSGLTFAAPVRLNPRRGSVSSYAESRPVAAYGAAGELLIAWSERRGDSVMVTDLVVRASGDGGHTLGQPMIINDDAFDGEPGFHGFPALVPLDAGGWFATWMDTREQGPSDDSAAVASLFHALSSDGGQSWSYNRLLAAGVSAHSRPTAAADRSGRVVVAFRSAVDGIRDPAIAVSHDRGRSFATDSVLSADGWWLAGCPVEGPALTLDDAGAGHYAWFTGADGGGVWIAPWRVDAGIAGVRRLLTDSLVAGRHPRLARLGATTLIALESRTREDRTRGVVAVRSLDPDGVLSPWLFLGADAGHAWMAATGERTALICWTEREQGGDRVRVVRLTPTAR